MIEEQLRKEFESFYSQVIRYALDVQKQCLLDWWLSHFRSYKDGLIKEVEGMEKEFKPVNGITIKDTFNSGYNAGIDDIITLIKK